MARNRQDNQAADAAIDAADQAAAPEIPAAPATPERNPENTPLPGGGRWKWGQAEADWVENTD